MYGVLPMVKMLIKILFRALSAVAFWSYKIEGINGLLLIMPAKLIVPTLRKYGATIGKNAILHSPLIIHNAGDDYSHLMLGDDVYFGRAVFLDLKDKIVIGNRATISMKVTLLTHTDVGESRVKDSIPPTQAPLTIGDDVYIGANVTVAEGVKIGNGAVVGACSFVRKSVAPHAVVAGVPAKEIKKPNV